MISTFIPILCVIAVSINGHLLVQGLDFQVNSSISMTSPVLKVPVQVIGMLNPPSINGTAPHPPKHPRPPLDTIAPIELGAWQLIEAGREADR